MGFYENKRFCNKDYVSYPAYLVRTSNKDITMWGHHLDDGNLKEFYEKHDYHTSNKELLNRSYDVSKIPLFYLVINKVWSSSLEEEVLSLPLSSPNDYIEKIQLYKILFQVFSNNGSYWLNYTTTNTSIMKNAYLPLQQLGVPYNIFDDL